MSEISAGLLIHREASCLLKNEEVALLSVPVTVRMFFTLALLPNSGPLLTGCAADFGAPPSRSLPVGAICPCHSALGCGSWVLEKSSKGKQMMGLLYLLFYKVRDVLGKPLFPFLVFILHLCSTLCPGPIKEHEDRLNLSSEVTATLQTEVCW